MAAYLGDINTRARGLRTHLLKAKDLERLARAPSLSVLQRELSALGFVRSDAPATAANLEYAIRRRAAEQMSILARWAHGHRRATFAVLLEDEDRRSLQAILRGAAQGAAPEARRAGLIPTTQLSERALQALASQPTLTDVVRLLVLWNHPLGAPLIGAVSESHPSLFTVENELQRAFARRALAHARKGGSHLIDYVGQLIDVMNAWSALLHFVERDPAIVDLTFVEGGRWVSREVFSKLLSLGTRAEVVRRLNWELRKSPLSSAFKGELENLTELESAVLRAQINWQNGCVRKDPAGAAPLIGFVLELRAQVLDLRRIIWGVALHAPVPLLQTQMVST